MEIYGRAPPRRERLPWLETPSIAPDPRYCRRGHCRRARSMAALPVCFRRRGPRSGDSGLSPSDRQERRRDISSPMPVVGPCPTWPAACPHIVGSVIESAVTKEPAPPPSGCLPSIRPRVAQNRQRLLRPRSGAGFRERRLGHDLTGGHIRSQFPIRKHATTPEGLDDDVPF